MPCGMLTITLFDIAAIASLRLIGEIFSPLIEPDCKIFLPPSKLIYSKFISLQSKSKDVSDGEHVVFLYYLFSHYFSAASLCK